MSVALAVAIVVGLVAGTLSVWVSHQWSWQSGLATAVGFIVVASMVVATTEVSLLTGTAALIAFSVPSLVDGSYPYLRLLHGKSVPQERQRRG